MLLRINTIVLSLIQMKGHYAKDTAVIFKEAARTSISSRMPFIMQPSISAIEMNFLALTLLKNGQKENTTILPYPILQKN